MKLKIIITTCVGLLFSSLFAQTIDQEIEFKTGRAAGNFAEKKMSKAANQIFINQFTVHFQMLFFDAESTRAGVNYGTTSASLSVGFEGIDESDLQKLTDQIYQDYVNMMKSNGYEIISADDLSGNKSVAKGEMIAYTRPDYEKISGYVSCMPTGFKSFYKKGKPLLSALIKHDGLTADVSIEVPFIVDAESGASKLATSAVGGVSKIVVKPILRIGGGSVYSYNWSGGSYVTLPMKSDLIVKGVFEDEKFKAAAGAVSNSSSTIGATTFTKSWNVDESKVQTAKCDPEKYKKGVVDGSNKFLSEATSLFMEYATK